MSHQKPSFFHAFFYITLFAQSALTSEASFLTSISCALGGISSASGWYIKNDFMNDFTPSTCPIPLFYVNGTHILHSVGLDDYDLENLSSNDTDPFLSSYSVDNKEMRISFEEDSCSPINLFTQDYYIKDESWKYMTFSDAFQNARNFLFEQKKEDLHRLQAAYLDHNYHCQNEISKLKQRVKDKKAKNRELKAEAKQSKQKIATLENELSTKENQLQVLRNTASQKNGKIAKKKKEIDALEKQIEQLEKTIKTLQDDLFYEALGMPVVSIVIMVISGAYIYIQNDSIKMNNKEIKKLKEEIKKLKEELSQKEQRTIDPFQNDDDDGFLHITENNS